MRYESDYYAYNPYNPATTLQQHGILGMKWGVWNAETRARYMGSGSKSKWFSKITDRFNKPKEEPHLKRTHLTKELAEISDAELNAAIKRMFVFTNPNPDNKSVGDCTVRALSIALNKSWEITFLDLCLQAYMMRDMPSSNDVWGTYLQDKGWILRRLQDSCPLCYTVMDFCNDHNKGIYILGTGSHVICVKNGKYYDAWDSGSKVPLFYYEKG